MVLEEKEIECGCGNKLLMTKTTDWCTKCGKKVFYHDKDRKWHKVNTLYMYLIVLGVITFLTYFFLEMIVTPFMGNP